MAFNATFDLDGFDDIVKKLDQFPEELAERAVQILNEGAVQTVKLAKQNITQQGAVSTGAARASIRVEKEATIADPETIVTAGGRDTTEGGFDYVLAIEFGTRPHFPPVKALTGQVEPLDRWVQLNATIGSDEDYESVAFLIARRISEVGIRARPFLGPAAREVRTFVQRALRDTLEDAINDL